MKPIALVVGRFQVVTRGQVEWLASLRGARVSRVVAVVTSANQSGTRRNPFEFVERLPALRAALGSTGVPFDVVSLQDVAPTVDWVRHLVDGVRTACAVELTVENTQVHTGNSDVAALFRDAGFAVTVPSIAGCTPQELIQRVVAGTAWRDEASDVSAEVLQRPEVLAKLKHLYQQTLVNDDGELGHARDFASYGAQMDASLRQKLDDLLPWVKPGCIVDQGCGTGKLMVELSRQFPTSRLVGVDLSREFLRLSDENTYATDDVQLIFGNVIERHLPEGSATTIVYSSVMHEVHSYTGYDVGQIDRALKNARDTLVPGGHVLIRDGISPPPATWVMTFLSDEVKRVFERFAAEFKHGQGAKAEWLTPMQVRLSAHDANEFLCKKDYQKNWHIEVHEEFGPLTLDGWRAALERAGLEPLHLRAYVNEWIRQNRYEGSVRLQDASGATLPWPATNAVIVGRRR